MQGFYLHVPFCAKICDYCDFQVLPSFSKLFEEYAQLVCEEIEFFEKRHPGCLNKIDTVYFGGGTPSILPPEILQRIVSFISDKGLRFSQLKEFSMEFNPESCTEESVENALSCGVKRISLGLQSLHPELLSKIGRSHSVEEGLRALKLLTSTQGIQVNADLMFDLPSQKVQDFLDDLDRLTDFPLHHVSFYGLNIAERTRLAHRISRGEITVDENLYEEMYCRGVELVTSKGFSRYEVSNFCKPHCESLHNMNYWNRGEYIGIGPGAHSYWNGKRFNAPEIYPRWREFVRNGCPEKGYTEDVLNGEDIWTEFVWLSLRQVSGIDLEKLSKMNVELPEKCYKKWLDKGFLVCDKNHLRLFGRGWIFMDSIVTDIISEYIPSWNIR